MLYIFNDIFTTHYQIDVLPYYFLIGQWDDQAFAYLPMIFIDGAHNSITDFKSLLRTQWYWKDLQFLASPANDEQFFLLAAASKEDRLAGHFKTVVIVFWDALQGSVNAFETLVCKEEDRISFVMNLQKYNQTSMNFCANTYYVLFFIVTFHFNLRERYI